MFGAKNIVIYAVMLLTVIVAFNISKNTVV